MLPIGWIEIGPALAVFALGVAYLCLCLIHAHYSPQSFSKVRHCLLKAAFFIYPLVSVAFITAFFITRRVSRTHTPAFVLFCTWELVHGLCLGAEITHLWLSIFSFRGVWIFAVACAGLLTAAVLVAGLWCYVSTQRQWLWVFIPILSGVLTMTCVYFTNDSAPIHARYRRHWGYLTLPALLGLGLGFVAALVPDQQAPTLQRLQYLSQSVIGFMVVYLIQVMGMVSAHSLKTQAKEASQAPRWDGSSLQTRQSRQSLIAESMSLEDITIEDLESLLIEGALDRSQKSEECEPRPDSSTLSEII